MSIIYAEDTFWQIESRQQQPPGRQHFYLGFLPKGQGEDGYGSKIHTDYMVRVNDEKMWRRVYCTCYSNNGSVWFIHNKIKYHFRIDDLLKTKGLWPQEWIRCPKPSEEQVS